MHCSELPVLSFDLLLHFFQSLAIHLGVGDEAPPSVLKWGNWRNDSARALRGAFNCETCDFHLTRRVRRVAQRSMSSFCSRSVSSRVLSGACDPIVYQLTCYIAPFPFAPGESSGFSTAAVVEDAGGDASLRLLRDGAAAELNADEAACADPAASCMAASPSLSRFPSPRPTSVSSSSLSSVPESEVRFSCLTTGFATGCFAAGFGWEPAPTTALPTAFAKSYTRSQRLSRKAESPAVIPLQAVVP